MNDASPRTSKDYGKVAVLYGGDSSERQVSIWSGEAVHAALLSKNIDAHLVDPSNVDITTYLIDQKFDRVFNILHGGKGEDGTIQAVMDYLNIPYTGSGVLGSSIGMNKVKSKLLWHGANIPVLATFPLLTEIDVLSLMKTEDIFPLAVKPSHDGSSVGVSKVSHPKDLFNAWKIAGGEKGEVFAERWIEGKGEYTCGILDGKALPIIRMETDLEFYDFDAKYLRDDTRYYCPSGLAEDEEKRFQSICERAFTLIGCHGWGRVDFVLDQKGDIWILEVNTNPGMTSHSLVPMAAKEVGIDYATLCCKVLDTSFNC